MTNSKETPKTTIKNFMILALFFLYIIALVWVIVFKCNLNDKLHIERNLSMSLWERFTLNIVPFKRVFESIADGSVVETLALIFNVVCFAPFGALLCFLTKKKTAILSGVLFSCAIEIFQLFSGWGGLDFMDVLLNGLGTVIGVVLYHFFFHKFSDKTIYTIAIVCFALVIPLDTYAIINTVLHFPV